MGREGFEQLMGFHAAPLLVGLRPASLLSFRRDRFDDFEGLLASYKACFSCKGIEVFRVAEGEAYTLLLFYRAACLRRHLEQAEVRDLLQAYGYPCDEGLDVCLAHLRLRMQLQKSFPHEIGLFLGYPVADERKRDAGAVRPLCALHGGLLLAPRAGLFVPGSRQSRLSQKKQIYFYRRKGDSQ